MDGPRFDRISKRFAERRLSRRETFAQTGMMVAVGALAAATPAANALAQNATPAANSPKPEMLFVQAFEQGSILPKAGAAGTYTLTLEHGLGQTIYFSDRPERIVGATPTADFLKGLGFPPDNPPNAALVLEAAPGDTDFTVMELFNPRYDETSHTATYDIHVLKDYEKTLGMSFAEQPIDIAALHPQFGAAHLLIDDCADARVACCSQWDNYSLYCVNSYVGYFPSMGYCYDSWAAHCTPSVPYCHHGGRGDNVVTYEYWAKKCNETFPVCNGICHAIFYPD
jgi:hypothetical protein